MGVGIWSMHSYRHNRAFVAHFHSYFARITASSLGVAIVAYFALRVVECDKLTIPRALIAGSLMGASIITMHYTGMAGMRMTSGIEYNGWLVLASIAAQIRAGDPVAPG